MDSALQNTLLIVAGVGAVAWLMRMFSGASPEETAERSPRGGGDDPRREPAADDLDDGSGDATSDAQVPLSAEGVAFVPRAHGVLLLPLVEAEEETPDWLDKAQSSSSVSFSVLKRLYLLGKGEGSGPHRSGAPLGAGDLTAARIVRGVSSADPWRLETLGRDGDYGFHPFATREGADAALALLADHAVVQRPVDDDGNSVPVSAEDFEEARRRYERTEMELAIEGDEDEPPREGPWVSDRR